MKSSRELLDGYVETRTVVDGDCVGEQFSLTGFGYSYAKSAAYRHSAATRRDPYDFTFQLTLSGRGVFEKDGAVVELTPGRGFLCDIRNDTRYCYRYPEDAREPWRFVYFQFHGAAACAMARRLIAERGNVFDFGIDDPLFAELPKCRAGHRTVLLPASVGAGVVMRLLNGLAASAERAVRNLSAEKLVQRAFDAINAPRRHVVSTGELADACGVSREHLSRVFAKVTGVSLNEYLHERLVSQILCRLSFSEKSVKAIAEELGFSSVNTMLRMFRNRLGQYPMEMRNEVRKR